jgi:hypothetical protein
MARFARIGVRPRLTLSPTIAAVAMGFSAASLIGSALRLRRVAP